ncbi:MAG: SIS domain-containing protein [Desulfurococcaceae archaeon]
MYLKWPDQIREVVETWDYYSVRESFRQLVVIGMGGSGIVGDYLQLIAFTRGGLFIHVVKSHVLPGLISDDTLLLFISYSGNTIETLLAFKDALRRRAKVVAVSSGGLLEEEALRNNVLHVKIPGNLLPRVSLPSMLYRVLAILDNSGYSLVTRGEARENMVFLEGVIDIALRESFDIAYFIDRGIRENRLLILSTHSPLEPLALRGKNEFNENSKLIVKVDTAPEWMHNDIVGYEAPSPRIFSVLEVIDQDNEVGVKLVDFMRNIYSRHDTRFHRLVLRGGSILEKLLYGSLVLGLSSVKLAEMRGVNPTRTESIQLYKRDSSRIFKQEI